MFFGTTPSIISQYLVGEITRIKPARVIVPFAGNFVVEQITGIVDKGIEVICTDVSLYSRAIGHYLDSRGSEIKVQGNTLERFPALKEYDEPLRSAIAVLFLGEVAIADLKTHIPYYATIIEDAEANQKKYCDKIAAKLESFKSKLSNKFTFLGTDGVPLVHEARKNDLVFYDPPVILGDYEKMFKALESHFEFKPPGYTQMTDEIKIENLAFLRNTGVSVFYRTNNPITDIPEGFTGVFMYRYKYTAAYCIYTNVPGTRFVGSFTPLKETVVNIPIISTDDEITEKSKIEVVHVKGNVANHYRLLWVKKATMKSAGESYLILIDGKIIGVFVLMSGMTFGHEMAVILSDPAAPCSKYKRLSKLVLYIGCTQQMLDMFNEKVMWEHKMFTTRVFTNEPVSMKYRSLFELEKREEDSDGNYRYCLIYHNKSKIFPTFQDGLKQWLKKDSQTK